MTPCTLTAHNVADRNELPRHKSLTPVYYDVGELETNIRSGWMAGVLGGIQVVEAMIIRPLNLFTAFPKFGKPIAIPYPLSNV